MDSKPAKVLFLDIDGVLNSRRTSVAFDGYPHSFDDMARFDHVAIGLIRKLCKDTDTAVVLSSDWRYTCTAYETANALDLPVIDITPVLPSSSKRGFEINAWLSKHPEVKNYAIVDDNDWMLDSQQLKFVRTDEEVGLSLRNYLDLKHVLSQKLEWDEPATELEA